MCRTFGYVALSCYDSGVMVMDRKLHHMYTCEPSGAGLRARNADFDNARHLLIASYDDKTVYIADSTTGDVLKSIPVGEGLPQCLTTQLDGTVLIGTRDPYRVLKIE